MSESRPRDALPELSAAARGICGAFFSDGARSLLHIGLAPPDSATAFDELLSKGVVARVGDAALRGTEVAAAVGWSVMLRAHDACVARDAPA